MSAEEKWIGYKALDLLRPGAFRRYIIGSAISDTGTWMQVMAQGWLMSTLTNKAILLGMANFAAGLPMLALTMIGGSAADRCDKRKILVATQVVQIAFALLIGALIMSGQIQIWHIIVVSFLLGTAFAFEMPALSALVPELVRREEIGSAIAFDRAVFHGARLVGPAVAGLIVALWGTASAFFANAFSFLAFIAALLSLPPRPAGSVEEEQKRASGIKDGFRYVAADRTMLAMVSLIAVTTVFIFPVISVMMPLYVRNELGLGPDRMGFLMAMSGIGAVAGAVGLLSIARGKRLAWILAGVIAVACGVLVLAGTRRFALAAPALTMISLGLSMNFGLANTIVQERAPAHLRGRISAVMGLSFFGLMPIAGLVVTSLSDLIGMRRALASAAIAYGLCALFIVSRAARNISKIPVLEKSEAEAVTAA
jgi:MFS family permease